MSGSNRVTLIDAGVGNLRSVHKALERLGAQVHQTSDPDQVASAGRVVLPGVGAFGNFMRGLREQGLDQAVLEVARRGLPLLGICVGMQAFFELGEEMGTHAGLGLLPGKVVHFPDLSGLKIPHTGWNQLNQAQPSPLLEGIAAGDYAYFNHSFYCAPAASQGSGESPAVAVTDYGIRFVSAVQHGALYGVQFHPEKSQRVGLQILANFISAG